MDSDDQVVRAPRRLRVSGQHPELSYEIADELVATHDGPEASTSGAQQLGDGIAVVSRTEAAADGPPTVGPVYRRVPGGSLVVPTGRVLVRFPEGDPAERHRDDLAAAGYDLDEVLTFAPHAAWLRAAGGDISASLARLDQLAAVPGLENVEPEMVGEVSRRD